MKITKLKNALELENKRSYNAKHFLIGHTKGEPVYQMDAHVGHIHYLDKLDSNRFREIDWKLNWNAIKKGWEFKYHSFHPFLPEYSNDWIEFRDLYQGKDQTIRYKAVCDRVKGRLLTVQETKEIVKETELNSVIYDNAFGEGIDLILYFTRSTLKKVVRIRDGFKPTKDTNFDFEVEFPDGKEIKRGKNKEDIKYKLDITKNKEFDTDKQLLIGNDKNDKKEWHTYLRGFKVWDTGKEDTAIIAEQKKAETIKVDYFIKDGKKFLRKKITKKFLDNSIGDVFTDTTTSYYTGAGDGFVGAWDTDFATTRALSSGTTTDSPDHTSEYIQNQYYAGTSFYRSFYPFDTSAIGAGATITAATFGITVYNSLGTQDFGLVQTTQASNTSLINDDFDQAGGLTGISEGATRVDITSNATHTFTLNATGRGWISKVGYTLLGLRIGGDIDNSEPGARAYGVCRSSEYAGTASDPYLSVTYTIPVIAKDVPVESGVGLENVLVNKDLIISEAGSGAEDIRINKEFFLTDSGVGAEAITITITAVKDVSDSGAGVDDVTVTKLPALVEKHILIKVYDNKGNYLESWDDATFEGFTKEINGGLGECQIKLGRKFDDYGEYFDVKHNNEVRILITDRDTRGTANKHVLIYSGYISKYTPWIEGGKEGVVVHCLGYYTQLAQDIYKNGTTTTIQETAADVGVMFRNLMDRYIAETTNNKLHYSKASILTTSTTATYLFEMMTYREAIEVIKSLAPTDWWWYVDQYHKVNFKSKPSTTDHTFIFGRHFYSVKVEKSMEKIKNALLFWNRETEDNKIYKLYTDTASVSDHGRRVIKHIDQGRVGATIDADKIGDAFVAEHKEPEVKVLVEIIDNAEDPYRGYDIESIEPGQTCIFSGFSEALSETFKENMMITKVEYTLEKVRLTIEPTRAGIVDRLEHVARQVSEANTKNAPSSYST